MGDAPFRLTKGQRSFEHGFVFFIFSPLLNPIIEFVKDSAEFVTAYRRSLVYHPVAIAGMLVCLGAYLLSPWALCALLAAAWAWPIVHRQSFRKVALWRVQSFLAGVPYRHRLRKKLTANGLLNDKDPTPTISRVRKTGCTTIVHLKMSYGDEINYLRERHARLAQTNNALECKINLFRRETLVPWKHEMVTKVRWAELEFLTKDPFNSKLGVEYIDFHRDNTLTPVVATMRNGATHRHNLAAHRLRVAMTRWGKSNAIRAMVYAQRHNIEAGLLELWGIDGKGGVEQSFLSHLFAYVAYGDSTLSKNAYNPSEFDRLLKAAVKVLKRRQRDMRGKVTEHIPTPEEPWLLIVVDELLVLTSKSLNPDLRNNIAASINLIQQQGIACGVSLDASTQFAQKDILGNIERGGFTELELGKVERGAVDMLFGTGWWERGVRADEIAKDLKGTFYKKTDATMVPEQVRYPNIPVSAVSPKVLGFTVEKSAFRRHLEAVPDLEPEPEITEPEPEFIGVVDEKPIQLIAGAAEDPPVKSKDKSIPPSFGGFA